MVTELPHRCSWSPRPPLHDAAGAGGRGSAELLGRSARKTYGRNDRCSGQGVPFRNSEPASQKHAHAEMLAWCMVSSSEPVAYFPAQRDSHSPLGTGSEYKIDRDEVDYTVELRPADRQSFTIS